MNRAYSILEAKDFNDDARQFSGIASTPSPDRMNDVVEPKGAIYKLPMPLLSQHEHHLPIGFVTQATITSKGIEVEGKIAKDTGLDYVETAWKQIRHGLVKGLSIGFRPLKYKWIQDDKGNETGGIHFEEWDWMELSAVTLPAQAEATILAIKSYDQDPVMRSQVVNALSERHSRINEATARIQRAKAALEIRNK
jgi:HK97 family phage prohead protease